MCSVIVDWFWHVSTVCILSFPFMPALFYFFCLCLLLISLANKVVYKLFALTSGGCSLLWRNVVVPYSRLLTAAFDYLTVVATAYLVQFRREHKAIGDLVSLPVTPSRKSCTSWTLWKWPWTFDPMTLTCKLVRDFSSLCRKHLQ